MMIALLVDDHGFIIVTAMDDTVADMYDIFPVNACFALQVIEEMRKGTGVVFDIGNFFLLCFAS